MGLITVRQANVEDAGLIADLSRQTFLETFSAQNSKENMDKFLEESFNRDALIREVGAPGNIFLLAFNDGKIAGYARLKQATGPGGKTDPWSMEIARIYADSKAIGRGVGKALMLESLEIAKKNGCTTIWLGVWEHNQRAIDFYLKGGFEKFGSHIFMLGDDPQTDWLMKKNL